ncbi:MAG: HXXEE domain-containing protein [Candidatus Korobacteraceae bacterium]
MIASLMPPLSRNAVLALIGITLVLHTVEEYLTVPIFLSAPNRLPAWLPPPRLMQNARDIHVALIIATVLPLAVIVWAILRPFKVLLILALLIESVLLVNAGWHLLASAIVRGYAPGVITAVLINLPFGVYVLRRAVKERWIGVRTARQLIGIALLLHIVAVGSVLAG